jgi:hypothetical protein
MKKSFKLSEYLEFMEPKYIYLKIVPSTSIRNYNSDNILKVIASLYRNLSQRVKIINKKFIFESPAKVSFYIYMEKSKVEFYFIVPEKHYSLFKDKITDTWNNKVTISIVTNIPLFNHDSTKFYLDYKNNDAMSLVTDKRNNSLLASELSTLYVMEEGDSAGVFFNFIPLSQSSWIAEYENAMKRVYSNGIITKSRFNLWSIFCCY